MLTLYHGTTSVCSQKVRYALAEKGLAYESVIVDISKGEQFADSYRKLNPNAVVPTLVHDGKVLIESSVIIDYLNDVFPAPPLMPADPYLRALAGVWLLRSLEIHNAINTMSYASVLRLRELDKPKEELEKFYRSIPDRMRAAKRRDLVENGMNSMHVDGAVDVLSKVVADMDAGLAKGAWVVGNDFSLADIGLIAYIDRLARLGMEGFWANTPRVGDWYARMTQRPSYGPAIEALAGGPDRVRQMRDTGSRSWPQVAARLKAA